VIGRLKYGLVNGLDQEIALVLGQGARVGLYQSIMSKPPNVRYVYPLAPDGEEIVMPDHLKDKDSIAIFNIESERPDDLMHDLAFLERLRANIKLVLQVTSSQTGVVIMGSKNLTDVFAELFSSHLDSRVHLVTTEKSGALRLQSSNQTLVWVSSCTQANLLSASEHGAFLIGYAKNSD